MDLKAIGVIHNDYKEKHSAPRQGRLSENLSTLEIFPEYQAALHGVEHVSHVFILYWLDQANREVLQSPTPFSQNPVGVFASRSPNRPNPIAICIGEIVKIEGNWLTVRGIDALDNSPLLDIKVYSAKIDCVKDSRSPKLPDNIGEARRKEATK